MLRLMIGKAGTGKTAAVISEIRAAVQAGRGGAMLLVPEQYSHEAERELCRACGDTLSRYAEVFSFTGLARRVLQQQGGAAAQWLDKGGRLLCMQLALEQIGSRLRIYDAARENRSGFESTKPKARIFQHQKPDSCIYPFFGKLEGIRFYSLSSFLQFYPIGQYRIMRQEQIPRKTEF